MSLSFPSADAVPLDGRWLATIVENLERDEQVAGAYGCQVPREGVGLPAQVLVNNLATAETERSGEVGRRTGALPPDTLDRASGRLADFDNISSCLRRSVWEEMPFERTNFTEDLRWGKSAVEAGYKTVYKPHPGVFHSHRRASRTTCGTTT